MTIAKNHKEYEINGTTWFVEQYADKPHFVWLWRYGYITDKGRGLAIIVKDMLS